MTFAIHYYLLSCMLYIRDGERTYIGDEIEDSDIKIDMTPVSCTIRKKQKLSLGCYIDLWFFRLLKSHYLAPFRYGPSGN